MVVILLTAVASGVAWGDETQSCSAILQSSLTASSMPDLSKEQEN